MTGANDWIGEIRTKVCRDGDRRICYGSVGGGSYEFLSTAEH
jgi:hypothetical protein